MPEHKRIEQAVPDFALNFIHRAIIRHVETKAYFAIPNILLKNCASSFAVPICHLFDTSFKDGVLPDC